MLLLLEADCWDEEMGETKCSRKRIRMRKFFWRETEGGALEEIEEKCFFGNKSRYFMVDELSRLSKKLIIKTSRWKGDK